MKMALLRRPCTTRYHSRISLLVASVVHGRLRSFFWTRFNRWMTKLLKGAWGPKQSINLICCGALWLMDDHMPRVITSTPVAQAIGRHLCCKASRGDHLQAVVSELHGRPRTRFRIRRRAYPNPIRYPGWVRQVARLPQQTRANRWSAA